MGPEQLEVSFGAEHNRKAHPEDVLEECWREAKAKRLGRESRRDNAKILYEISMKSNELF